MCCAAKGPRCDRAMGRSQIIHVVQFVLQSRPLSRLVPCVRLFSGLGCVMLFLQILTFLFQFVHHVVSCCANIF